MQMGTEEQYSLMTPWSLSSLKKLQVALARERKRLEQHQMLIKMLLLSEGTVFVAFTALSAALLHLPVAFVVDPFVGVAAVLLAGFCLLPPFRNELFPCLVVVSLCSHVDVHSTGLALMCSIVFLLHQHAHSSVALLLSALWASPPVLCYTAILECITRAPLFTGTFAPGERHVVAALIAALAVHVHRWPESDLSLTAIPVLCLLGGGVILSMLPEKYRHPSTFVFVIGLALIVTLSLARVLAGHFMLEWAVTQLRTHSEIAIWSVGLLCFGLMLIVALVGGAKGRDALGFAHRKLFHALIVGVFAHAMLRFPKSSWHPALVLASMAALCALLVVEFFRTLSGPSALATWLNSWYGRWIDARDAGSFLATTHIQLLLGCSIPLYLTRAGSSDAVPVCGLVVIGIGDAMAAVIGSRFGTHRWAMGNRRTLEGSMSLVVASAVSFKLLAPNMGLGSLGIVCIAAAAMEALMHHTDNLLLPLFVASLLY